MRTGRLSCVLALLAMACTGVAQAQEGTAGGSNLRARVGVNQTFTDNLRLASQDKDAALITTLSPGVTLTSASGALRGSLDYALNGIAYVKTDQGSQVQHTLSANGLAEIVDGRLYVDVRASIGQQSASAFGQQAAAPTLANSNQREVGTLNVSPYWVGQLGAVASYELRGNMARTEARGSSVGDSRASGASLRLSGVGGGPLGWWLLMNQQRADYSAAPANQSSNLTAGLTYRPDPDVTFGVNLGRERSDYLGNGASNGVNTGINANWTPTPRTRVAADWQRHAYGNSHSLSFEHRMARSVWRLSDSQTLNLGNTGSGAGVRSNYDQFYLLLASQEPDPVRRDALVRSTLQTLGLSPDAPVANGFVLSGPSRLRSQQLSGTLQGLRSSITAQFNRSVSGRVGSNAGTGDLATSGRIEQRSLSVSAGHQLSPLSSLSLTAARLETEGDQSSLATQLTSLTLNWSARLGMRLSAQLGGRHSRFEGAQPYTENAVYANLTQQF